MYVYIRHSLLEKLKIIAPTSKLASWPNTKIHDCHLFAVLHGGAQRLFHKNVVGPGMPDNIQKNAGMRHVWCGNNYNVAEATVQQVLVMAEHLSEAEATLKRPPPSNRSMIHTPPNLVKYNKLSYAGANAR